MLFLQENCHLLINSIISQRILTWYTSQVTIYHVEMCFITARKIDFKLTGQSFTRGAIFWCCFWFVGCFLLLKQAVTQCKINTLYNRSFIEEFFALKDVTVQCPEMRKAGNLYCWEMLQLLYPQYCAFMKNKAYCLKVADVSLWLHKHCVMLWMCMCEKCENMKMLQKAIQKAGIKGVPWTLVKCLWVTWCEHKDGGLASVACAKCWCPHCGVHRLRQHIMEATTAPNWKATVKYRQW